MKLRAGGTEGGRALALTVMVLHIAALLTALAFAPIEWPTMSRKRWMFERDEGQVDAS